MVSGENGLFVWVHIIVGLRLDFGIQYSMVNLNPTTLYTHTNKPFSPLTIEYWIPKSNLNPTTLYTHTNKPFSPLTIEYIVGLRLDFGIQYSMVCGKNGLVVWVYSVVGLRLDFGIQS
jgi:hypothetical protein